MSKSMTPAGPCKATGKGPIKAPAVQPSASADRSAVRTSSDFFSGPSTTVSPCSFKTSLVSVMKSLDSKCRRSWANARDINASQAPRIWKSPMPSAGLTASIEKASCSFPQSSRLVCSAATCDSAISCSKRQNAGRVWSGANGILHSIQSQVLDGPPKSLRQRPRDFALQGTLQCGYHPRVLLVKVEVAHPLSGLHLVPGDFPGVEVEAHVVALVVLPQVSPLQAGGVADHKQRVPLPDPLLAVAERPGPDKMLAILKCTESRESVASFHGQDVVRHLCSAETNTYHLQIANHEVQNLQHIITCVRSPG
mmetsp:Transcript_122734/g.281399  ORF Transcript_122734/g.281399 Transcript_122734/m.281399 type:complete len:309 (+) Transcript_122734:355-1281(+)